MLFYIIMLFLFPIFISVCLNLSEDETKNKEVYSDFKIIDKFMRDLILPLLLVSFTKFFINGNYSDEYIKLIIFDTFYYLIFIALFVYVNYFSTRYSKFRFCIKTFLDATLKFLKENFILNLLFFALLIFSQKNDNLTIGLIGAYLFFALDKIHIEYKNNIDNGNTDFKLIYKVTQIILNFLLLYIFTGIEKGISQTFKGFLVTIEFKYSQYVLLLALVIIVNRLLPEIESFIKHRRKKEN